MTQQKWDINNIEDQKGRVCIVTGSSSGIGFETARVLAAKNTTVLIAVRNLEKGHAAVAKIKATQSNADVSVMVLDLANLKSIRAFAEAFKTKHSRLDLLINNAGVMVPPYSKTQDGFELQMGTNHMGHFALTGLLMDVIQATPGARIVNVSSLAHRSGNIDFDDLNWEKRRYKKMKSYGDSKLANLYFTYELQRRLAKGKSQVTVAAAHPGWTATELQRHNGLFDFMNRFFAQESPMGALPTLYAAAAPDVKSGDFIGPSGFGETRGYPKKVKSNALANDTAKAAELWDISEQLTAVTFNI